MDKMRTLQRMGTHLLQAAVAGVDVMLENEDESHTFTTVLAGNNRTGKTTLLYTAKFGCAFNRKLVVPTVGYNFELLDMPDAGEMAVIDVGGGSRMGPLFYKYVTGADALVYVVRADDPRFVSAAWELYMLLSANPEVHVRVLLTSDTTVQPETARLMTRLLQPDALPPTRSSWDHIFELYNVHPREDKWTSDREWVERKGRTASHGFPISQQQQQPVRHTKTWTVTRVPPCTALLKEQALQPFVDLHRLVAPPPKAKPMDCLL